MPQVSVLIITVVALLLSPVAQAGEKTILVLDASGSMWGQINGVAKIEIARDALKTLIKDWPADRETGLVVYGHRRKGDCTDIETVIPPGPLNVEQMVKSVDAINPKGKTPLSAAVKQAAEALKYTEDKATVILISDGIETCDLDPCKLGEELEKTGVDFTAHVIGFDVNKIEDQKGLRCLAAATGGDFIPAADAAELNEALEKTAKAAEPAPEETLPEVTLIADDSVTKGTAFVVQIDGPENLDGRVYLYVNGKEKPVAYQRIRQARKNEFKVAELFAPAQTGDYTLKFLTLNDKEVTAKPLQVTDAAIALAAPEEVSSGQEIAVEIKAPAGLDGRVYLYPAGGENHIIYRRIGKKGDEYKPVELQAPVKTGDYVLRFKSLTDEPFAEKNIRVVEAPISLDTPDKAIVATEVKIGINAPPGIEGRLFMYRAGKDKPVTYQRIAKGSKDNYRPVNLRMPAATGEYELVLKTLRDEVLARKNLQIEPAVIALKSPDTAPIATTVKVSIDGPPGLDGRIYLFATGKDKPIIYQRIAKDSQDNYKPARLRMPTRPGSYIIRLRSLNQEDLAEKIIEVLSAEISLQAPDQAAKNSFIQVTPVAPVGVEGRIYLYRTGKEKPVTYQRVIEGAINDYDPVRLKMPSVPGAYIFRLKSLSDEVLAEKPVQVTE